MEKFILHFVYDAYIIDMKIKKTNEKNLYNWIDR